jgi:hypothetical protein
MQNNLDRPLFVIDPEVPGGFGDGTLVVNAQAVREGIDLVPVVQNLNYRFDGWMGDDIITFLSVIAVTDKLGQAICTEELTGVRFEAMTTCTSDVWEQWADTGYNAALPTFERIIPMGSAEIDPGMRALSWSGHDLCMGVRRVRPKNVSPYEFVVTDRFLSVLRRFSHEQCTVQQLER